MKCGVSCPCTTVGRAQVVALARKQFEVVSCQHALCVCVCVNGVQGAEGAGRAVGLGEG